MTSYNQPMSQGFNNLNPSNQNSTIFSRLLRNISNWGMVYDEMVTKNKVTIGINEDPQDASSGNLYDFFSQRAVASLLSKKSISYLDKAYLDKRRILREYSIKDEIREFIDSVADECVIYDDEKKFCKVSNIDDGYSQEIKDTHYQKFEDIYHFYGFADGKRAWDLFKKFLIDGFLAFEIVYDDKQQNIIGFEELDTPTIIPGYDPSTGTHIWIQFPEEPSLRRIVLDSQIIYISYKSQNEYSETSYVEPLIRPYNQLKLIEQTKIMFNMAHATVYQKFVIPIKDLSKPRAEESIAQMIANYSEEVVWDDTMGTVEINGQKNLPYNKSLWFPEGESGTPQFDLVTAEGHNLNENDMLEWFYSALKRASRIPFGRFDKESGGGNIFSDASEMTRDEIKFSNFISRLRTMFKELIVKPLKLQLLIEYPELKEDKKFLNDVNIEFNSNDLFEEWKRLNNQKKRVEIVGEMLSSIEIDERPYFHPEYLIDDILKLSEEEKQKNRAYWEKYPLHGSEASGGDDFGGGDFGGGGDNFGGGDFGGGGDDFGGGDFGGGGDLGGGDIESGGGDEDNQDFEF